MIIFQVLVGFSMKMSTNGAGIDWIGHIWDEDQGTWIQNVFSIKEFSSQVLRDVALD